MPILTSQYKAPIWIGGKHAQTIIPGLFRKVEGVPLTRERISTEDRDFLDLDWSCHGHKRLAIISHGLEGNSRQAYILGMIKVLTSSNWDSLAWNFRGCSGQHNHSIRLYHAGSTGDLKSVVEKALSTKKYQEIALLGFSLGGSITLKYLGDEAMTLPSAIVKACVFSVPCDLYACARSLATGINRIYLNRFLTTLKAKIAHKAKLFPEHFSRINLSKIQDFIDLDNLITAPLGGFKDALHYYIECSCKRSIPSIKVPTLIVNAGNDPFLHPACFPHEECQRSQTVFFECPYDGGHQGFIKKQLHGIYWSEERALEFLNANI
jgi:predicted alpha/beta-fold hydrolase